MAVNQCITAYEKSIRNVCRIDLVFSEICGMLYLAFTATRLNFNSWFKKIIFFFLIVIQLLLSRYYSYASD